MPHKKPTYLTAFTNLKNYCFILFSLAAFDGYSQCVAIPTTTFTQPTCLINTGTITITNPIGTNYQYSINGINYQASPSFPIVAPGSYSVYYKDMALSCTSPPNPVTINTPLTPTPAPTVITPVYYCQNSTATALSATATTGNTLNWYGTNATGGTASAIPTVPSTTTVGSVNYYVSQTNGICESPRVPIVVTVSAPVTPQPSTNPFCDNANSTTTNVAFDWSNVTGYQGYMLTYSIGGGPFSTPVFQASPSHIDIPVTGPGISVTFTILSVVGVPCAPSQTVTCHSDCINTVTPTFNPILVSYCQNDTASALPTTTTNSTPMTGTWSPATINTAAMGTTNYTFTPDPILFPCGINKVISVTVSPKVTPTFATIPATLKICQGGTAPVLPTTSTNAITGTWSPAVINTATLGNTAYNFTPAAGQCVTNTPVSVSVTIDPVIVPIFSALQTTYCQGAIASSLPTVSNNTIPVSGTWNPTAITTTTAGTFPFTFTPNAALFPCAQPLSINIVVNPKVIPTFNAIATTFCAGATAPVLATASNNGIAGTWNPAAINTSITGTTNYVFTPNAGICAETKILSIVVNPLVTPVFAAFAPVCQNDVVALPTSSNNIPPITGTWSPAVNTSTAGTFTYTFMPTAGQCVSATPITISLTVVGKTTPNFAAITPFCSYTIPPALSNTSPNGVDGTWLPATIDNTQNGTYVFTPNNDQCAFPQTLNVTIIQRTVPTFPVIAPFCNGSTAPTLPLVSQNAINGTWLPATIDNTASGQYIFTPDPTECAEILTVNVVVTQPEMPNFEDYAFCAGTTPPVLQATSPNGYTGTWLPAVIDNTISGSYVFTPNAGECAVPQTIQVTVNQDTLQDVSWTASAAFEDNQILTVLASGPGSYLYQLDFGPFQESPVFENVIAGTHTVTVMDQNGCSAPIKNSNVLLINYPKYFTPNGDGFHDTWNIIGLENSASTIFIFDRHGKLLKQISPNGAGWNGTFNGHELPSSDYWFTVEYTEYQVKKEFKAHFALKR